MPSGWGSLEEIWLGGRAIRSRVEADAPRWVGAEGREQPPGRETHLRIAAEQITSS